MVHMQVFSAAQHFGNSRLGISRRAKDWSLYLEDRLVRSLMPKLMQRSGYASNGAKWSKLGEHGLLTSTLHAVLVSSVLRRVAAD
jgi:hypothetical protein